MGKKKVVQKRSSDPVSVSSAGSAKISKKLKRLERSRVYVSASYNNTSVSVTDGDGNVIAWATAGSLGFSGPKKATPFAASKVVAVIVEKLNGVDIGEMSIYVKGIGGGRDSAVRSLANHGFNITSIQDVTPIPHNGPRARKPRRV